MMQSLVLRRMPSFGNSQQVLIAGRDLPLCSDVLPTGIRGAPCTGVRGGWLNPCGKITCRTRSSEWNFCGERLRVHFSGGATPSARYDGHVRLADRLGSGPARIPLTHFKAKLWTGPSILAQQAPLVEICCPSGSFSAVSLTRLPRLIWAKMSAMEAREKKTAVLEVPHMHWRWRSRFRLFKARNKSHRRMSRGMASVL